MTTLTTIDIDQPEGIKNKNKKGPSHERKQSTGHGFDLCQRNATIFSMEETALTNPTGPVHAYCPPG